MPYDFQELVRDVINLTHHFNKLVDSDPFYIRDFKNIFRISQLLFHFFLLPNQDLFMKDGMRIWRNRE